MMGMFLFIVMLIIYGMLIFMNLLGTFLVNSLHVLVLFDLVAS